jgi:uracil-DNA glycosylase
MQVPSSLSLTEIQQQRLSRVQLEPGWKQALTPALLQESFAQLRDFLRQRQQDGATLYPPAPMIFNAFTLTPLDQVKVVIVGQDPYHGPRQANGLAFSVQRSIPLPPSLQNIFHELNTDLGIAPARHGDLSHWAEQGVLLLNSVLTVEAGQPTSHQGRGWEAFTDAVIEAVNQGTEHTVFILWGSYAQKKGRKIDTERHLVLTAAHPSPLAANRGGFFGCKVFSRTNQYLIQHGKTPIDWQLPR